MRNASHTLLISICLAIGLSSQAFAQHSLAKAELYFKHGLQEDAKREAIEVIFSSREKNEVAGAKLLLAQAAVKEGRLTHAIELWQDILSANPDSPSGSQAQVLLSQVISLTGTALDRTVDNAIAQQYFASADFWLDDLDSPYGVDVSWMPTESAAVYWLDKIIKEFPATPSAELAMYYKVRAYLGVKGTGEAGGGGFGVLGMITKIRGSGRTSPDEVALKLLMTNAKEALNQLEAVFPESRHLPILKFMIADTYWMVNKKEDAEPWLEQILTAANSESLWSQLARLRQSHWRGQ